MSDVRMALCQLDTVVGDIAGNVRRITDFLTEAEDSGADIAAFPELTVTGYPPEDLLLRPGFVADNLAALNEVAAATSRCTALVGFVDVEPGISVDHAVEHAAEVGMVAREAAVRGAPRMLRNALAVCAGGQVMGIHHKRLLPNYGVFDEHRWFGSGTSSLQLFEIAGWPIGVSICEDAWFPGGPIARLGHGGAGLVVNINASPYSIGRQSERIAVIKDRAAEAGCAIAYVNQVGGQDELVFDGGSFVVDGTEAVVTSAEQFVEQVLVVDLELTASTPKGRDRLPVVVVSTERARHGARITPHSADSLSEEEEVYNALVLGTRDYMRKNGFTDAVVGMSGGIDSSLVATVAVDALGSEHVHGISMPSRYSSDESRVDATELASNLGIELHMVPIESMHLAFAEGLLPITGAAPSGLTDENLQSRIRGVLLMAASNAKGWIVLTTGNKSEVATGYSTLYGDSAGGFAVIKDVPKTLVYRLCRYRNYRSADPVIPESVLDKPPSAELRPGQRDDQKLPPYDVLDPILLQLVEHDHSIDDVVSAGYDKQVVTEVARLVDGAEYKRRQSPPGVRISRKAFGKDRRMPITNRYRDRFTFDDDRSKAPTTNDMGSGVRREASAQRNS